MLLFWKLKLKHFWCSRFSGEQDRRFQNTPDWGIDSDFFGGQICTPGVDLRRPCFGWGKYPKLEGSLNHHLPSLPSLPGSHQTLLIHFLTNAKVPHSVCCACIMILSIAQPTATHRPAVSALYRMFLQPQIQEPPETFKLYSGFSVQGFSRYMP